MALTRESFCRYASSTCQRTSSDREPTLLSSKFWGGRLLASLLCKASYKFVCCGRDRAWCSRGLPIGVEGSSAAGSSPWRCGQRRDVPRRALAPAFRARGCPSPDRHSRQDARYPGRAAVFGAGCGRRLHAQTAPATSIGAIRMPPWAIAIAVLVWGSPQIHIDQKPVLRDGCVRGSAVENACCRSAAAAAPAP